MSNIISPSWPVPLLKTQYGPASPNILSNLRCFDMSFYIPKSSFAYIALVFPAYLLIQHWNLFRTLVKDLTQINNEVFQTCPIKMFSNFSNLSFINPFWFIFNPYFVWACSNILPDPSSPWPFLIYVQSSLFLVRLQLFSSIHHILIHLHI